MSEPGSSTDSGGHSPFGLPRSRSAFDDAELCSEIRHHRPDSAAGRAAFGELYARHRAPALHFALRLNRDRGRAEDAVSEAFAKVWRAWTNGKGPDTAFKPYLMAAVRSESYRRNATNRATAAVEPDVLTFLAGYEPGNHADEVAERDQLGKAFKALPRGWQNAITMIDIDGTPASSAAESLNLSTNSFNSLLRRAREGLRVSYLQQHVEPPRAECSDYSSELARYVRGQLSAKRTASVEEHLRDCSSCRLQTFRLRSINSTFQAWITPAAIAAALIEFGRVEGEAALLLHSDAGSAGEPLQAQGGPPSQSAAGSTGIGSGAATAVSGATIGLKATIACLAAAAAIAVGAITVENFRTEPTPPPASAQERSTAPAMAQPSVPTDSGSPRPAPEAPKPSPSSSPGDRSSQEAQQSAPTPSASPAEDASGPRAPEGDAAAPASPEAVDRSKPSSEDADDRAGKTESPKTASPGPSRSPSTPTAAESGTDAEAEPGPNAAAADTEDSGEAETLAEANGGRDPDASSVDGDSTADDSSSAEQADAEGTDAAADDDGGTGGAADSDDADGSHAEDGTAASDDDDGGHCHDFGWWQYCH